MTSSPAFLLSVALGSVFVPASEATEILARGGIVLDARGVRANSPYLPGAIVIDWLEYRDGWFRTGRLDDDEEDLREELGELSITTTRPVLVYGEGKDGWGDEGRVWWMLHYLGHPNVMILDGGIKAWQKSRLPTADNPSETEGKSFVGKTRPSARVNWKQVNALRLNGGGAILDARTRKEYDGATPYYAKRGGHIPGAKNLYWTELLTEDGTVLSKNEIIKRLAALGVTPDDTVITYCTGGVRSAFLQAILVHAGFSNVANYDGSWWDWAQRTELPVE